MKKILISNDDGIESPGIAALASALGELGEVTVVAPHRERSTSGHSLTLHKPLRIFPMGERRFATSGTPADCIYLGIREILKEEPDIIVSGINAGANLGTDVHYSGTVAAAREGALMNIRSYAFSLVDMNRPPATEGKRDPWRFPEAARLAKQVVASTLAVPLPSHTFLNVNIPNIDPREIRGLKVARQGIRYYSNEITRRVDPRGHDYFWLGGAYLGFEKNEVSDCHAVNEGFLSLTPITIDGTHNEYYTTLSQMTWKLS